MLKPTLILSSILLFFALPNGMCQGEKVDQFFQEDGLPNDLIKSVTFDDDGFLWVATDDGIVKMLGNEIVPLKTPSNVSSNFKSLLFTSKYGMLCSADGGLLAIKNESHALHSDLFQNYFPVKEWPKLVFPKTLFEAKDSSLWFSDVERVYHVLGDEVITYFLPEKNFTDHYSRSYQFVELANALHIVSQRGFIYRLNEDQTDFVEVNGNVDSIPVNALLPISSHAFLLGTETGLLKVSLDQNTGDLIGQQIFSDFSISSIDTLVNGDIVFGTWDNGAFQFDIKSKEYSYLPFQSIQEQVVNDIAVSKNDQIWFASDFGLQLVRKVPFNAAFNELTTEYIQDVLTINSQEYYFSDGYNVYYHNKKKNVTKIYYHSSNGMVLKLTAYKGGIAMSTNNGQIIIKSKQGNTRTYDFSKKGRGIYSLVCDWQHNLWFIQDRGDQVLVKWNEKNGEILIREFTREGNQARMCKISPYGEVYVGAYGADNYLYCYNPLLDKVENLSQRVLEKDNRPFSVIDIAFGKFGKLFLATEYGVWVWTEDEMFQLDLGSLSDEMVSAIELDSRGGLWIANSNGLIWFKNNQYKIFNNNCGLPSKSIPYRTLKVDSLDNFVFGTISGLAQGKLMENEVLTPKPVVSSLQVSGKEIDHKLNERFLDDEILHFAFAAPTYPAKLTYYSYCLDENNGWTDLNIGDDRVIFSGMQPGSYELKFRARSVGFYDWSLVSTYSFNIYKVWYERAWVKALFYFSFFFIVFMYIVYIRRKNRRTRIKLEKIIEERTGSLKQKNEELVTLNEDLNQANVIAEEAVKTKDKFFSVVAHDLKSPFNALIGISELLTSENGNLPKETTDKLLKEIYNTSENTYKLLQNLLDWARSQTGSIKVQKTLVLLSEVVVENVSTLELSAKQKGLDILNVIDNTYFVNADRVLLSTVLRNLISNAIKFSDEGGDILIDAQKENDYMKISVKDTGVGIEEEQLTNLFSVGESKSTLGTANETGTGLGLMLCHEYVLKMNGRLLVNSEVDKGSEFIIFLPLSLTGADLN